MPLVRREPPRPPETAGAPDAAPSRTAAQVGAALVSERDPRVREALLAALLAMADEGAAAALASHLRSEDASLRNACIEALQAMPVPALSVLPDLLADPDPDVRLLATEVARTQPPKTANALLARLLDEETHPNVCGAAVEVLAEVGTPEAVPALRAAQARFSGEAFLPLAIDTVLVRLGAGR